MLNTTLNPNRPPLAPRQTPRFGFMTQRVAGVMNFLEGDRTRQMLVEDFMGFGVLRTVMDLFRGYFFDDKDNKLNIPAGVERMLREVGSIITDNISSGVAAFFLGKYLDKKLNAYSNRFTSYPTLEFFQEHLQHSLLEGDFLQHLAKTLSNKKDASTLTPYLQAVWEKGKAIPTKAQGKEVLQKWTTEIEDQAVKLAKALGQTDFDFTHSDGQTFALNELMIDLAEFRNALQKQLKANTPWKEEALGLVKRTLKAKNIKLASCLWVGLGLTFSVPYAIRWFTHTFYHLSIYPGELGLRPKKNQRPAFAGYPIQHGFRPNGIPNTPAPIAPQTAPVFSPFGMAPSASFQPTLRSNTPIARQPLPVLSTALPPETTPAELAKTAAPHQPWQLPNSWEHFFPYLTRSVRQGNFIPLIVSLIPLPFAAGFFDTVNHKKNLPFTKGFVKRWRNMLDFGKRFPFTTQQQIASLFAFLIFSRLTSARSENEFRERTIDSFLGWGLWILATPWIQKQASRLLQGFNKESQLLKANGRIRTGLEIERFLVGAVKSTTKTHHIWLGAISTLATMGLIGLFEPWLAIQWTKRNGASST